MKYKPKQTRTKMSESELIAYNEWTKKSAHVFADKTKYERRKQKRKKDE